MNPDLSIVVPAHNEEECIESTLEDLCKTLEKETIDYEVIVSNDHSTDSTGRILDDLCMKNPRIKHIENTKPNGFGFAVRSGFIYVPFVPQQFLLVFHVFHNGIPIQGNEI